MNFPRFKYRSDYYCLAVVVATFVLDWLGWIG
jgi:hypothetical protein